MKRLELKQHKLCSDPLCISHATHGVLYRRHNGTYLLKLVCEHHLLSFLAPEMWALLQKFAHGTVSMKEIYRDARDIFDKVNR